MMGKVEETWRPVVTHCVLFVIKSQIQPHNVMFSLQFGSHGAKVAWDKFCSRSASVETINYVTHNASGFVGFFFLFSGDDAWRSRRAGEKVCCARVTFMLLFVAVRWRRSEIPQLWE